MSQQFSQKSRVSFFPAFPKTREDINAILINAYAGSNR